MRNRIIFGSGKVFLLLLILTAFTLPAMAEGTDRDILIDFTSEEVSLTVGKLSTSFVYNDGNFFIDSRTFSPELAKASVALSGAAYSKDNLDSALTGMPGFDLEDVDGNWNREYTMTDQDFVCYRIAVKRELEYKGENYIVYCVVVRGTTNIRSGPAISTSVRRIITRAFTAPMTISCATSMI